MVPLKIMVSDDQKAALSGIKQRTGVPINEQVRRLVDRWIDEQEKASQNISNRTTIGGTTGLDQDASS